MASITKRFLRGTSLLECLVSSVTLWVSVFAFLLSSRTEAKQDLYIGGFFPLDNVNWDAAGLIPAAEMAIADVNKRTDLLADYELQMEWNNTKCDAGVGMASLFDQITASTRKVMLLGAGCTLVTGPMAETAQYWNLVQVSHSSSSPSLNNRGKYPLLFRLYPSEESMNYPRLALMKQFGWKKAALLHSSEGGFSMVIQHMRDLLIQNSMVPMLSESFTGDPTSALENIKVKEARIIIANMFESTARGVFCKARGLGMTGPGYIWIIPGWFSDEWYLEDDTTCSPTEMTEAVSGYISMETQAVDASAKVTNSGRTPAGFLADYQTAVASTSYTAHDLAPFAYDSVYTIALALNASINPLGQIGARLEDFEYTRSDIAHVFFTAVNNSNFAGITGPIRFDINGKRLGYTKIEQLQDGVEVPIATFDDSLLSFVKLNESAFIWSTENGEPPPDGPLMVEEWRTVSLPLVITMTVLAVAGVLFVIFLLVINIMYRDRRIMKLSAQT
ncbi:gamma-aminobutyric acid type B receptor subunit 1-like [Liolophura sinensis]|uniref:gamma-aminobutyric acid type B receptor subunit 1-like n=1 Tax=Liolophura sinensis TaxID=3198878 RepID=UPI00315911A8